MVTCSCADDGAEMDASPTGIDGALEARDDLEIAYVPSPHLTRIVSCHGPAPRLTVVHQN
jgi:hypothetical protein